MDNFLSKNLKLLRERKGLSLADMAQLTGIGRTTLNNYENGNTEPKIDTIVELSKFFGIDVGDLLTVELSKFIEHLDQETYAHQGSAMLSEPAVPYGKKDEYSLRKNAGDRPVTIITVDTTENSVVPILDAKVAAGSPYILDEPDYYKALPSFTFPNHFVHNGALASIQVRGDSMHPTIKQGDYIVGKEIESLSELRNGEVYLIIYQEDHRANFLVKRCFYHHGDSDLLLTSDNKDYPDDNILADRILKLYHAVVCLTTQLYKTESPMRGQLERIEKRIDRLETRLPRY